MTAARIAERLQANAVIFQQLLVGVDDSQARWRPAPGKWSLLEVINHLADEERDDFRRRLDLVLHHPGEIWPRIDPPVWAEERRYNSRELDVSLRDFLAARKHSVEWLRGLTTFDENAAYPHPALGRLTAGMLLHSWLAHDLLHIRQMTRLHYEYLQKAAGAEAVAYAGSW